jgi:hypothetical protein
VGELHGRFRRSWLSLMLRARVMVAHHRALLSNQGGNR